MSQVEALETTIQELSWRGLVESAKWLLELRLSLTADGMSSWPKELHGREAESDTSSAKSAELMLAKSYFDCREFARSAHAIAPDLRRSSRKARFLYFYCELLLLQRRVAEEDETGFGLPTENDPERDMETARTMHELEEMCAENADSYLDYLLGLYAIETKQRELAAEHFIRSVSRNAYNWASWRELASLTASTNDVSRMLSSVDISDMSRIFRVVALTELHKSDDSIEEELEALNRTFPGNHFFTLLAAVQCHNVQDFEGAKTLFERVYMGQDPFRLDYIDHYSNVLFVLDQRKSLAYLARRLMETDRHRPETCTVIGNYYSNIGEHEQAVAYFRQALQLDARYASAWTLMGHEYVELKNPHAAIESYRRAIDFDRRDYRAWYGLGQTYEMLEMHYYALHYFERAAALKPLDARMWNAIAGCFEKLGRFHEAIRALRRALGPALDTAAGALDDEATASADEPTTTRLVSLVAGLGLDAHYVSRLATIAEKLGDIDQAWRCNALAVAIALSNDDQYRDSISGNSSGGLAPAGIMQNGQSEHTVHATAPAANAMTATTGVSDHLDQMDLTDSPSTTHGGGGRSVRHGVRTRSRAASNATVLTYATGSAGSPQLRRSSTMADISQDPRALARATSGMTNPDHERTTSIERDPAALPVEFASACVWLSRFAKSRGNDAQARHYASLIGYLDEGRSLLKQLDRSTASR
ncbi:Anaphase-promoting complex subunit 8 [Savitreella phatthalungensis]